MSLKEWKAYIQERGVSCGKDQNGRLHCSYCKNIIGQYSDGNNSVLLDSHEAPCGLICCNSKVEFFPAEESGVLIHTGDSTCERCKARPCPVCAGSGVAFTAARTFTPFRRITCQRCNGRGKITGRHADE